MYWDKIDFWTTAHIAKILWSTSIENRSDTFLLDWYLINIDLRVFALWEVITKDSRYIAIIYNTMLHTEQQL